LIACDAGRTSAAPAPTPTPKITPAQQHVLDLFDPDIVGTIAPRAVDAGTYSMALAVSYDMFPSMEMRISGTSTGSLTLTLGAGGKAHACATTEEIEGIEGQWHYEPAEKREPYREHKSTQIVSMSGSWSVVDGTTLIAFDAVAYNTCEPNKAQPDQRSSMLRCIATGATKRLPADAIACVETNSVVQLGMPMSRAERDPRRAGPAMGAPHGQTLVLARGGLNTKVEQSHSPFPSFTFSIDPVH
jgi:hypothetical protein